GITWTTFWIYVANISAVAGLLGSIFAFLAWIKAKAIAKNTEKEKMRLNQEVTIRLQGEDDEHVIELPFALRRGELARFELLGLIGMLPMIEAKKRERFVINFFSTPQFRLEMSRMQDADQVLEWAIPCTNEEIEQFDREKIGSA
ncbi:MAG: hypothetical protein D3908_08645, partial [Candidatus Electrothrix sp. AUS4]|nr:hypothetical protein [Candidatus Electrothrix sp. AUS4]